MMCDLCGKNPATTHVRSVVNGTVKEENLCSYCAAKKGYGSFGKLSLANMLASMFGDSIESGNSTKERCSCCGSSFSDIVESGKAGCSECYKVFSSELEPSLSRLHGKVKHVGKIPNTVLSKESENRKIIESMRDQLKQAVKNEQYETAAELRDKIKSMEENENKKGEEK